MACIIVAIIRAAEDETCSRDKELFQRHRCSPINAKLGTPTPSTRLKRYASGFRRQDIAAKCAIAIKTSISDSNNNSPPLFEGNFDEGCISTQEDTRV
jgi:hypothetical protein